MTGSFLDTTIIVNISDPACSNKEKSSDLVNKNQPCDSPYYALRELMAGHLHNLCDLHNIILASENIGEALSAISRRSFFSTRQANGKTEVFSKLLSNAFENNPDGSRSEMANEMLEDLALRINMLWRSSKKLKKVDYIQALGCFDAGKLKIGLAGELVGPNNSFNCNPKMRCSAAQYMYEKREDLAKMIEALHPKNLPESLRDKNEILSRRKALKELDSVGPDKFSKSRCRALGDAYFASMCPPGKTLLTTNISDFEPICNALSKTIKQPD